MNTQIDIFDPLRDLSAFLDSCKARTYAGIGSRETPDDVLLLMRQSARRLEAKEFRLRSGGAKRADSAFESAVVGLCDIFLPWPGFEGRRSLFHTPTVKAVEISRSFHPNWHNLTDAARKLMARNAHQVLGATCDDPCAFVLCWTPDGSTGKTYSRTGGTGQAIRIAHAHDIPVFNLQRDDHREAWEAFANG